MSAGAAARLLAVLGLILLAGLGRPAAPAAGPRVVVAPASAQPGDVVVLRVSGVTTRVRGEWAGRPLAFAPVREGVVALAGVDLDTPPAPIPWRVSRPGRDGGEVVLGAGRVPVRTRAFGSQELTLPREQVDLDAATLARVRAEAEALRAALAASAGERLWRGGFLAPVEGGRPTGGFGLRRIINGQPRSPHAGADWAAERGAPVLAANAGRVVLVAEQFFAGRLVVLDHGLGLFTLYFHLDEVRVAPGEAVTRGQRIGAVGATGRATGPHLHLAVSLGAARVDPDALLALPLPD